jgi:hypothetical protein
MKEIQELIKRLESEISKTPTGKLRNLLCDANIILQHQALNMDAVSKQREQLIFLIEKFQTPEGNYIVELLMDKLKKEKLL